MIYPRHALIASSALGSRREPDLLQAAVGELAKYPGGFPQDTGSSCRCRKPSPLSGAKAAGNSVGIKVGAEKNELPSLCHAPLDEAAQLVEGVFP